MGSCNHQKGLRARSLAASVRPAKQSIEAHILSVERFRAPRPANMRTIRPYIAAHSRYHPFQAYILLIYI
ncbi:hypothetical protein A8H40_20560 [Burkholderia multivorans]|nr:hypothetical protein A8H40_20560 [Burkholderia multivorans]EED98517.1 hypothetical protein BURMUCGD1_2089 [Burkholderia multivorans CGD1]EJO52897.1 hypothetical protein BURMUCF1_1125 [Burkholderia multivorans ATCC BAA-247]PRE30374.1 hypothetical protein C6P92_00420 [Burkholderia multivorans]PRE58286.1 hypothetical protein C6P86_26880 [Burkholderia multivorans]